MLKANASFELDFAAVAVHGGRICLHSKGTPGFAWISNALQDSSPKAEKSNNLSFDIGITEAKY
jgi:hypothetical protein